MASQIEEVVISAYSFQTEHFRPDIGQDLFHLIESGAGIFLDVDYRRGQRLSIHLSVRRQRKLIQKRRNARAPCIPATFL